MVGPVTGAQHDTPACLAVCLACERCACECNCGGDADQEPRQPAAGKRHYSEGVYMLAFEVAYLISLKVKAGGVSRDVAARADRLGAAIQQRQLTETEALRELETLKQLVVG